RRAHIVEDREPGVALHRLRDVLRDLEVLAVADLAGRRGERDVRRHEQACGTDTQFPEHFAPPKRRAEAAALLGKGANEMPARRSQNRGISGCSEKRRLDQCPLDVTARPARSRQWPANATPSP